MIDIAGLIPVLEHLYEGVYLLDTNKQITYWNKGAEKIAGYSNSEVVNKLHCGDIFKSIDEDGTNQCDEDCRLFQLLEHEPVIETRKVFLRHRDGHQIPVTVRAIAVRDNTGDLIGSIKLFHDFHSKEFLEKELREFRDLAMIDQLTGLKNRRYADTLLQAKLVELKNHELPFGILFIDIDHFKQVNDHYGHRTGDIVLQMVARTLINNTRPSDVIIRWGGEEIVVVLVGNLDTTKLKYVANKLRILVEQSNILNEGRTLSVTVSIGATLARDEDDPDSLMIRADQLMYSSKGAGRNRVTVG